MNNFKPETRISVAAVPYFWEKKDYQDFYRKLNDLPVDIVYLGETVCSKRRSMKLNDWLDIAEVLSASGKQVVLSSMTLLEAESEVAYLQKITGQKDYLIEANDVAAVQLANSEGNQFVAGSAINLYNLASLRLLNKLGLKRWVVPVELGKDDLAPMIDYAKENQIEIEYQIFGRMPLAYSARCFTARHHQLSKDNCQLKCQKYHQGLRVNTQEGEGFVQINGIQTQSAKVSNLIDQTASLIDGGVSILRVVPVSAADTLQVVGQIVQRIKQKVNGSFEPTLLENEYQFCNGYWFQIEGMKYIPVITEDAGFSKARNSQI